MSTFILGTDDVDDVRRFGEEVAPPVRDLVDAGRRSGAASDPRRPAPAPREVVTTSTTAPQGDSRLDVRPTPDDGTRFSDQAAWDESTRPTFPVPASFHYSAQQQAAPQHLIDVHDYLRVRARPPARPRRAGPGRPDLRRLGPLGDQPDDVAAEQLDPRRLLRAVLPGRHRAPQPRGRQHVPAPAPGRGGGSGRRPAAGGARGHRRAARPPRPGPRRPRRRTRRRARSSCRRCWTSSPTPCSHTCPTRSASCCTRWRRAVFSDPAVGGPSRRARRPRRGRLTRPAPRRRRPGRRPSGSGSAWPWPRRRSPPSRPRRWLSAGRRRTARVRRRRATVRCRPSVPRGGRSAGVTASRSHSGSSCTVTGPERWTAE